MKVEPMSDHTPEPWGQCSYCGQTTRSYDRTPGDPLVCSTCFCEEAVDGAGIKNPEHLGDVMDWLRVSRETDCADVACGDPDCGDCHALRLLTKLEGNR